MITPAIRNRPVNAPARSRDPVGDYARIARAIDYLRAHATDQPTLAEVAAAVHLSEFHLQRLFSRWAGVSPKRFLQILTVEIAKRRLREPADVLAATHAAGLSGPGRLHDLFVAVEAVTPGEFTRFGRGLRLGYGVHPSPFGWCFLACTARGVCRLEFLGAAAEGAAAVRALQAAWPDAGCEAQPEATGRLVGRIFARRPEGAADTPLPLLLCGTNFQVQVWRALLRVPPGARAAYGQLAAEVGRPAAVRAVGSAVGANPVAVAIPCHRVLRADGSPGGYHWGLTRKVAINAWETAQRD